MTDEREPARKVEGSIEVDAPQAAVWKALTDGEVPARRLVHVQGVFPESRPPLLPGDAPIAQ